MYIRYDESELFEFFECEPVPVGDDNGGDLIFTYSDNEFKLILFLSTYEMYVNISITYKDNIVYSQKYSNVLEINQIERLNIKIVLKDGNTLILKKNPQIGVIAE